MKTTRSNTELRRSSDYQASNSGLTIVISTSGYPPSRGGTELICQRYAEGLAERGHHVQVLAPDLLFSTDFFNLSGRQAPPEVGGSAAHVTRLSFIGATEKLLSNWVTKIAPTAALRRFTRKALLWLVTRRYHGRLHRAIAATKPDVVVALVHLFPNVRASINAARRFAAPSLVMPLLHEEDENWPYQGVKECVRAADGVLSITRSEAATLQRRYAARGDRTFYVGAGVDMPAAEGSAPIAVPTVLFLGRKTEGKGLPLLAEATEILLGRGLQFNLSLVGASADDTATSERPFEELLGARFLSLTNVSEAEKASALASCSCLVLPSDRESFGLVLLEAWSFGKPVVAMDYAVSREIVDDGVDGLLVRANDPEALANALASLLQSPARAERLGEAGRRKAADRYTWSSAIDRLEEACRAVVRL